MQTPPTKDGSQPLSDHHRPHFHFLPPANWMNDPNGLIQWRGVYHLFYQYNPNGPLWGTIHWGHATSVDLVNWQYHPLALIPGPEGYDHDGCWSGCAVDDDGRLTLLYTGKGDDERENLCLARVGQSLDAFEKHPANPLNARPPQAIDAPGFRDPFIWREGDQWRLLLGSGVRGEGGAALLYTSQDLLHWDYQHPLAVGDGSTGEMWECPNFIPLGDRHLLIMSALPQVIVLASVGDYADGRFTPDEWQRMDGGDAWYAPQVFFDNQQRPLVIGWIKEERDDQAQQDAGWSGVMSLPRVLSAGHGATPFAVAPVPELKQLRANERAVVERLANDRSVTLPTNAQGQWEVELLVDQADGAFTLTLEEDGATLTEIVVDLTRRCASLAGPTQSDAWMPFTLPASEPLRIVCFFDHSVVECFVQGQASLTKRVYPHALDAVHLRVASSGAGTPPRVQARVWDMQDATFSEAPAPQR